jgi:hypothetical protein
VLVMHTCAWMLVRIGRAWEAERLSEGGAGERGKGMALCGICFAFRGSYVCMKKRDSGGMIVLCS